MHKLLQILALIFLLPITFIVAPALADPTDEASFQLGAGYRVDKLNWNIDGGGAGPNIISELEWENLKIYQIEAGSELSTEFDAFPFAFHAKGSMAYGWIVDGENQDSDFAGDNRTLEFSRSNNTSDDGYVVDLSAGVGLRFRIAERVTFTPLLGYSYHEQNLRIQDGVQTIATDDLTPPLGPFPGLDSTYETRWHGPWTGIDLKFTPVKIFSIYGSFEYHWTEFDAEAQWNLRSTGEKPLAQPKSFEHEANGEGIVLSLGGKYELNENWSVLLDLNYRDWVADDGIIRFFPASGGEVTQGLNEVNWESWAATLGVTYRFL